MTGQPPLLVVLAGGSNSRFWPLREKSLFPFLGQPLLEHQLRTYTAAGFRRIVVVANSANRERIEAIARRLVDEGNLSRLADIRVVTQEEPRGMGDALLALRPLLEDGATPTPVYVCQVHDVFDPSLHARMLQAHAGAPDVTWLASYQVARYFPGGYLAVDNDLRITGIVEKPGPGREPSNLVNIVAHVHPDLGRLLSQIEREYRQSSAGDTADDHYERAMQQLMKEYPFQALPYAGAWHPVKYPWHVLDVMHYYLDGLQPAVADDASIAPGAHISGPVRIESGVRILDGASIVGPVSIGRNTLIGQYSHVRHSIIGEGCVIGLTSEVNRSYIGRGANLHSAKALDSVLADTTGDEQHINLSAGMITANLRSDGATIRSVVKGERIDTGRAKLGAIIGRGAFIGIGAMLMPGIKVGEGSIVGPATLVRADVGDRTLHYAEQRYKTKSLGDAQADDTAAPGENS